jgi:hypothetical protein
MDGLPSIGEWPFANQFGTIADGQVDAYGNGYVYVMDDCNGDTIPDTPRIVWNVPPDQRLQVAFTACATDPATYAAQLAASGFVDANNDGIPESVNIENVVYPLVQRLSDFDGFVFTDPTQFDTDADGLSDSEDRDPLVNPQTVAPAFGTGFERALAPSPDDQDLDNDGLGDGSDFGNDLIAQVDFPSDIADRVKDAAPPDRFSGCDTPTLPEALIEDVLDDDWNGDGMWRLTDETTFRFGIPVPAAGQPSCLEQLYGSEYESLFVVNSHALYGENPLLSSALACKAPAELPDKACVEPSTYNQRGTGMGWQEKLLQAARARTTFFPDVRLWAILYAWRVPGFDIDGNGRTGTYDNSFSTDDVHAFYVAPQTLCGGCGSGPLSLFAGCAGFLALRLMRPGRRV